MTDKETLIKLLNKIQADYTLVNRPEEEYKSAYYIEIQNSHGDKSIRSPGYLDFVSHWYFDKEDNLVGIGNWE